MYDPGRSGWRVPSRSERSESSESSVLLEKGKRPRASSMREMPRDQTSDLTVYCAPCIRSGYERMLGMKQVMKIGKTRTDMYVDVPTKVSAMELMSSPETPKSQILISPFELKRMLEGLMSAGSFSGVYWGWGSYIPRWMIRCTS